VECPQKIFEIGECAMKLIARDAVRVAGCIANSRVSFEDISSVACALVRSMGFEYKIQPASDSRFLEGRSATISVGGTKIGIMGEINPKVLNNWGIENPVVAFELSADKLMEKL
jgi:phenylalanyl-tRNA synthetase beta chain